MADPLAFDEVRAVLAAHNITGTDAETAFSHWRDKPPNADGARVQRVLEVEGWI